MVYEGAILELDQWDLHDIDKIEVVRGPSSVTYGTGAIAGVINIITKKSGDSPKTSVNLSNNLTYQSKGGNVQYSNKIGGVGVYGFLSYRKTEGYDNPNYFSLNSNEASDIRYVGKRPDDLYGPQDYLSDSLDRPQIKAHMDVSFSDNFNVWLRYTQSGQTHNFTTKSLSPITNNPINRRKVDIRGFVTSGEYKLDINENSHLKTSLTFDNQEYIRRDLPNIQYLEDHINNVNNYAFSQQRLVGSILYDYSNYKTFNIVTGYEYSNIGVRSPWHQSDDHIWIKEGVNLISSINDSVYMQNPELNGRPNPDSVVEVGDGFDFTTHSHLIEATYQFNDFNQILYAHRIDIPDTSGFMFSPRLSFISDIDDKNTIVITAQRAERMMQLRAQYLYDKSGNANDSSDYETLDGIEVSYTNNSVEHTSFNFRAFYNDIHAIGFTGTDLQFLTDVKLLGIELEAKYKHNNTEFIFNHSYIDTLDVNMNESLKDGNNRNNISFADYYFIQKGDIPILLESYGDGLNNLSSHVSKFLITQKFLDEQLIAQLNMQVYWSYDGSYPLCQDCCRPN
jgi:outer membrane receptor protein involved in Fe transport